MFSHIALDTIFLLAFISMWLTLFYHGILTIKGYGFFRFINDEGEKLMDNIVNLPGVSVMVPAKNEGKVIEDTLDTLLDLNYPLDKIELVIINDGSTDNTKEVLDEYAFRYKRIKPVHIPEDSACHGKSAALNEGLKHCSYNYIVVFDGDNRPEKDSVQYLVRAIIKDEKLAAVCGKIRTFNRSKNLLTRFANIEFISHQWLIQAGNWRTRSTALLPGTNYIIRKDILLSVGGWNVNALAEDTELSFRLFSLGYIISFFPLAVSWEQEPENWKAWRKQRLRWVQGNKYIIKRYIKDKNFRRANFINFFHMLMIYYLLLLSIVFSDIIFILGLAGIIRLSISGPLIALWGFTFIVFILEIAIALTCEVGEATLANVALAGLMYFTYCQQWLYIVIKSFFARPGYNNGAFWAKTERF
ncbi:MAG: glycosyltransferase family 2 protein [Candidatus Omnitrophota bacterium]